MIQCTRICYVWVKHNLKANTCPWSVVIPLHRKKIAWSRAHFNIWHLPKWLFIDLPSNAHLLVLIPRSYCVLRLNRTNNTISFVPTQGSGCNLWLFLRALSISTLWFDTPCHAVNASTCVFWRCFEHLSRQWTKCEISECHFMEGNNMKYNHLRGHTLVAYGDLNTSIFIWFMFLSSNPMRLEMLRTLKINPLSHPNSSA